MVARGRDGEAERRADYYRGEWVHDALDRYLNPPEAPPPSLPSLAQHLATQQQQQQTGGGIAAVSGVTPSITPSPATMPSSTRPMTVAPTTYR
jgi:hypothetical protein